MKNAAIFIAALLAAFVLTACIGESSSGSSKTTITPDVTSIETDDSSVTIVKDAEKE